MKPLCPLLCLMLVTGCVLPAAGGSLTGTVLIPGGKPLAGAVVSVLANHAVVSQAVTSANGTYQFTGLPLGRYRIEFFDPSGWYAQEFHDNQRFFWNGAWVNVGDSPAEQTINATLTYATPAPTGVAATDGIHLDRITITWDPVPGAAVYQVLRSSSTGQPPTAIGGWRHGLSFNDTSAYPTRIYNYYVRAGHPK